MAACGLICSPQVLTDYCFAWMLTIARHGTGTQLNPVWVEFVQQRANLRALERHLGFKVTDGASRNAIMFHASDAIIGQCQATLSCSISRAAVEEQLRQYKFVGPASIELVRQSIQDRLTGQHSIH